MKKYLFALVITSIIFSLSFIALTPVGQATNLKDASNVLNDAAGDKGAGFETETDVKASTIAARIGQVINVFLGLVGAIATLYVIYGGFMWITAGGNSEQVGKAKKYVINAALGLIISSMAYLIIALVISLSSQAAGTT